jgi:glycosyltransferase involved in cell wall biosynthesis
VIQEAFAAGLPVLASDVYGNAEQITDGINGWLFRFNDVADLKSKLAALINDTTLIEKTGTRAPGLNTFKEVGEQHMELYDSVIQNYNGF